MPSPSQSSSRHQPNEASNSANQAPYVDLEELKNADDLVVIISMRRSNGSITYASFREFDRDGEKAKTNFIHVKYIDSHISLLKIASERVEMLRTNPTELERLYTQAGFNPTPRQKQAILQAAAQR